MSHYVQATPDAAGKLTYTPRCTVHESWKGPNTYHPVLAYENAMLHWTDEHHTDENMLDEVSS